MYGGLCDRDNTAAYVVSPAANKLVSAANAIDPAPREVSTRTPPVVPHQLVRERDAVREREVEVRFLERGGGACVFTFG